MQQKLSASGGLPKILRALPLLTMILIISSTSVSSQSLLIHEKNGKETGISFNNIQKIAFSSGNLIVDRSNGTNASFLITGLRNLQFTESTINTINTSIEAFGMPEAGFLLFPNPSTDVLNLRFLQNNQSVYNYQILSFNGKSVLSNCINNGNGNYQIDIKDLPKGLYLFRLQNGNQLSSKKFIKN